MPDGRFASARRRSFLRRRRRVPQLRPAPPVPARARAPRRRSRAPPDARRPLPAPRRARARGCGRHPHPGRHRRSRKWPSVSVPVLSSTTCVTRASASIASGRASTTPRRASAPAATASAAGVASENAQGHETDQHRERDRQCARDGCTTSQTTAVAAANSRSPATKMPAIRSASARDARPRARRALGHARDGGEPRRVAGGASRARSARRRVDAARQHASPGPRCARPRSRRSGSLLRHAERPSTMSPSAGTVAPGRTSTMIAGLERRARHRLGFGALGPGAQPFGRVRHRAAPALRWRRRRARRAASSR